MLGSLLAIFLLSGAAPFLRPWLKGASGWVLALVPLGAFVFFAAQVPAVSGGTVIHERYLWVPSLDANMTLVLDGLSLLFALLITGIGTLVTIYAGGYFAGHHHLGRFYPYLFLFMGAMLGLVLADNVIMLFVFWELTSISSYLLIGFNSESEKSRASALMALLVTGIGGLALLAGVVLLGMVAGTFELSALPAQAGLIRDHALYLPILLLVLAGAFTKSAQFPFHFWLPAAMEAPTPVSAYLHSATMVKAGIYLMARLSPTLGGTEMWSTLLTTFGAVTMLVGAGMSLLQTDLKRILAYATVSVLGTLTFLLGLGSPLAAKAAIVYLLAHSLYKGSLFLVAGSIDHETGTRDIRQLGGLARAMPLTAVTAVLAVLSFAGLPPLFGFIGKEIYYEAVLDLYNQTATLVPHPVRAVVAVAFITNALMVAIAAIIGWRPFFGPARETPKVAHEGPPALWLGALLLAVTGAGFGLASGWAGTALVARAAGAVFRDVGEVKLAIWHGVNSALIMSGLTLLAGILLYFVADRLGRLSARWASLARFGPTGWYRATLAGLMTVARVQTKILQSGHIRSYLLITLLSIWAVVGYALFRGVGPVFPPMAVSFKMHEIVIVGFLVVSVVAVILFNSRLAVITALGVIGYSVALIFLFFGAPDLAMTQMTIETLSVILFVLVLYRLPSFAKLSSTRVRLIDGGVAVAVGGLVTTLMLSALAAPMEPRVSPYYAEQSLPMAKGHNVVNVILVDFRALDTLGEITVLAVAAIGVYALLRLRMAEAVKP